MCPFESAMTQQKSRGRIGGDRKRERKWERKGGRREELAEKERGRGQSKKISSHQPQTLCDAVCCNTSDDKETMQREEEQQRVASMPIFYCSAATLHIPFHNVCENNAG